MDVLTISNMGAQNNQRPNHNPAWKTPEFCCSFSVFLTTLNELLSAAE